MITKNNKKRKWQKPEMEVLSLKETKGGDGSGSESFCTARFPTTSINC